MSFFQNLFSSSNTLKDTGSGETGPVKMSLDERMAFRREMLFDSVKATMESKGILSGSYKFKVVRADKRGHSFVVMVDLSTDFMDSEQGRQRSLAALGAVIGKNALARYGLGVSSVYWRVNEELRGFDPQRAEAAVGQDSGTLSPEEKRASNVRRYERATAEELAAFESAWQNSSEMTIGDRTYSSDLAPLGGSEKDSR
ncbi:hypothetical protein [Polaromonas sp. A23]|uniref:hypothetical protein n=1 Tax=Polaromonas sp. A23 TaxID=1944133 RepID=UPI0009864E99|nr:hypothetical protein [Polaromonas sp. A23]OOG37835.1 hypothetical protein B0B52_17100 [Polaromonas sp. A23]